MTTSPPTSSRTSTGWPVLIALPALLAGCLGETKYFGVPDDLASAEGGHADAGTQMPPLPENALPFDPVAPSASVAKVKNLMTGLAATDAEVQAVTADPKALRGLIDAWMARPEFEAKMVDFFRNAFQQNNVDLTTLADNLHQNRPLQLSADSTVRMQRNLMDSFALTAWELVKTGRPFHESINTRRYMMTSAMMSLLAFIDERHVADDKNANIKDWAAARSALDTFSADPYTNASLAQVLDPASPDYMRWNIDAALPGGCTSPPFFKSASGTTQSGRNGYEDLLGVLFGLADNIPCYQDFDRRTFSSQFSEANWSDWRMVTVHATDAARPNTTPTFWDVLGLRSATEMWLRVPRVGFFGTLAFQTNWGTNTGNQARVTANQALIVAIGRSINGANSVSLFPASATDADHAASVACSGCHNQLDPLKNYFRQSYTLSYHEQLDPAPKSEVAGFNIDGVQAQGNGIASLADTLAAHPRFALAWVQKLHFWANNAPLVESDPEVQRIVTAFQQSNHDFKVLVRELFSSPLITFAAGTKSTATLGVVFSVSRRDHFCAALSNRLGLPDVCGMRALAPTAAQQDVGGLAGLLPVDTYFRSYELPSLPTNPNLFFRSSTETMCGSIANLVVDAPTGTSRYSSARPTEAIADLVATVMALGASDARAAQATAILTDQFNEAKATGVSDADALRSTFTLACIAPSSVLVGL